MSLPNTWAKPTLAVLAALYMVGVVGFVFAQGIFQQLTPYHLLLSALLVFLFHRTWNARFVAYMFAVFLAGYGIEWLGVHTGAIFGKYHYENGLGFAVGQIPLLIGINWLMLTYTAGMVACQLKTRKWVQAIFAALLMTLLDVFIEPFAMQYHLWAWEGGAVPLQNYLAWFLVALVMQLPFQYGNFDEDNVVAEGLYLLQLLFFILLRLLILS